MGRQLTEEDCILAFSVFSGIGPVRYRHLIAHFSSASAAYTAPIEKLQETALSPSLINSFDRFRESFDIWSFQKMLRDKHITPIPFTSARYPRLLREIPDPPLILYVFGKRPRVPIDFSRTIAVVGSRKTSAYGKRVTADIVKELVLAGCTIVSGMAYGIDEIAHCAALESGGLTIAVLGCGVDIVSPARCRYLYERISDGRGAVVSEMPPGLMPSKGIFPARNRIIAGLSLGVVVVEGTSTSGALITASYAAAQGRDVFAIPGPVTSELSGAPNMLLKNGAKLVTCAAEILEEYHFNSPQRNGLQYVAQSPEEQLVLMALAQGELHIDDIREKSGLTMQTLGATVSVLEIKGAIKHVGGGTYALTH